MLNKLNKNNKATRQKIKPRLTVIDLFCGTGGFAHGFVSSGHNFELIYAIDSEQVAVETTKANHKYARVDNDDIRKVDPKKIKKELGVESVDLIIGGPPCQGFSSLRPNRSNVRNDERNNLFLNYAKFIKEFRPKMFVLENVVGLVTHKKGKTLEKIIETFSSIGYKVDWKILNAASYGVPQKRERFILIGSKDNRPIIFPKPIYYIGDRVIGHVDKSRLLYADTSAPAALTVNDAISDLPTVKRGQQQVNYKLEPLNKYQRDRRNQNKVLTLHKAANHSDKMMEIIRYSGDSIASIPKELITSGFSSCYSRLDGNKPSTTITVKFQSPSSSKSIHPKQHRTITPREAARIQSFDDDYLFKGSLTQIANQLGNAVPPLLGKAIANAIYKCLN